MTVLSIVIPLLVVMVVMSLVDGDPLWSVVLKPIVVVAVLLPVYLAGEWLYAAGRRVWAAYRPQQDPPPLSPQE